VKYVFDTWQMPVSATIPISSAAAAVSEISFVISFSL
jgi:hypothetical protein